MSRKQETELKCSPVIRGPKNESRDSNSLCIPFDMCYFFAVARKQHLRFFQHHLSSHEFFRLLSYTASYF